MYASCVGLGEAGERQVRDNGGTSAGRAGLRAAGGHRGGEAEDGAYDLRVSHDARASAAHTPVIGDAGRECFARLFLLFLVLRLEINLMRLVYSYFLSFVASIQLACDSSRSLRTIPNAYRSATLVLIIAHYFILARFFIPLALLQYISKYVYNSLVMIRYSLYIFIFNGSNTQL